MEETFCSGHPEYIKREIISDSSLCPICQKHRPVTTKDRFYARVNEKEGIVIGNYVNNEIKLEIKCRNDHIFSTPPRAVLAKKWCQSCAGNSPILAKEKFLKKVEEKGGLLLEEYVNTKTEIKIQCEEGHVWQTKPVNIKKNFWYHVCSRNCSVNAEEKFRKKVEEKGGEVVGIFEKVGTKIEIKCGIVHTWNPFHSNITSGNWCPICSGHCPIANKKKFMEIIKQKEATLLEEY